MKIFLLTVATASSDVCIINAFLGWRSSLRNHHDKIEGSRLANEGRQSIACVSFACIILNDIFDAFHKKNDIFDAGKLHKNV
jgi:hypothetical protein